MGTSSLFHRGFAEPKISRISLCINIRSSVCTYGDLEIFLSGLELSSYIQLFQRNLVTFPAFLRMTDHDLQQVNHSDLFVCHYFDSPFYQV